VIYIAMNPVQALIVPDPRRHPGLTILPSDWGRERTFEPPDEFFRFDDRGEGAVTISPTPPPGFEHVELEKLRASAMHEIEMKARRIRRSGARFWGFDDVLPWDCPRSLWARRCGANVATYFPSARFEAKETIFDRPPQFQAADKSLLPRAHHHETAFLERYSLCRESEKAGDLDVVYPEGTLAYRTRHRARTAPLVDRGWYPLLNYG